MKQEEMITVALAGVAVLLIFKATSKNKNIAAIKSEPFRSKGDGSTGNWQNDFGYAQDKQFMQLIGL